MILKIIEFFGSQKAMGEALKVDKSAVSRWTNECFIPPLRAIEIEVLTSGKFKAVDIVKSNVGGVADE